MSIIYRIGSREAGRERLAAIGVDIRASTPEELASFQREEQVKWAKIIKDSGAKPD